MADSIWWTKMLHKDFCAHYCEMSDSEIVADVRRSVASLMMQRSEGSDFGALMVRMAMERIEAKHETAVANGQQGGRPRKNQKFTADGDTRTREGSQGTRTAASITRNEPLENDPLDSSANNYGPRQAKNGDAGHREAPGESANISKNYDQETDRRMSTDEALDLILDGVMATSHAPTRKVYAAMPSDVDEVYAFASAAGLDTADAYECWSVTIERGGKTSDGKPVKNWKAYVRSWCATRAQKRRTA